MREEERVLMDATREEERVCTAHNTIIISSESLSSDDSLETPSDELSDSKKKANTNQISDII